MPRNVNPASITVGAGIAPQGTVEDNSLRHPQRDIEPLRAHLLDPNNAHMASAIGIVDAGGYYASTDVEGALQEIGAGGAAGRQNGLVFGGTFTTLPGLLTLDTPTVVLIGSVAASFGGATVVLPPSVTRYVWIDTTTSTLTASAVLPPVSSEPILIAKVTTDAGANVTSSQDARFFVANLDRKVDYTLRSDGSAVNDASEACFVTLDAALFWLENYVATAQERKALVLVRGEHTISSTVAVPSGIPNIEFRGEGAATFATGASLNPVFNVSGTVGLTFTGITFRCDHAGSVAIRTATGALPCSNVTVQDCRFTVGGSTWDGGVVLDAATPATQQGHRVLGSQFTVNNNGVRITSAVDGVVRDCTFTGTSVVGSTGVSLTRVAGTGENCVVENAKVVSGFSTPFNITTFTSTLRDSQASGGGSAVSGENTVVDGCTFTDITSTIAGLSFSALAGRVSNTSVTTSTVWLGADDPAGIRVTLPAAVVSGCYVSGFYNGVGLGAGVRLSGGANIKVTSTHVTACNTGVELLGASAATVAGCTINANIRGVYSDAASAGTRVENTNVAFFGATGLTGIVLEGAEPTVVGCQITIARPFNAYLVGEVPAGIMCGSNAPNGPYTITGCTISNFYNSVGQVGGGVVYKGIMSGLTVSGCTFNDCGVIGDTAAGIANSRITGCLFDTPSATLQRTGVNLLVANTVSDVIVSGCTFSAASTNTGFMVDVSAATVARFTVANCTYSVGAAPGGSQRFVNIIASAGGDAIIEGNTVAHPTVNTLGPLLATGLNTLLVTNNVLRSNGFSLAKALETDAKAVNFVGNTVTSMNGIVLVGNTGTLPVLTATGNTFDCGDNTAAYGVQVVSSNGALALDGASIVGNTFTNCLHAAEFVNTLGTLTVSNFKFAENTVTACRYGLTTDAGSVNSFAVCSNEFFVNNYALYNSNTLAQYSRVAVDGNIIRQQGFVVPPPPSSFALVMLAGNVMKGASLSRNLIDHAGDLGAILLLFMGGVPPEDVAMDDNIVRNEDASAQPALRLTFTVTSAPLGTVASNISASRNKVNHFGGGFAAVRVAFGFNGVTSGVRDIHVDDNEVRAVENNAANNGVEVVVNGAGGVFNTAVQNVSLCRNLAQVYGASVRCDFADVTVAQNITMSDNTALFGNVGSQGAVVFECLYTGAVPAAAAVSNVRICGNHISNTEKNAALTLRTTATAMNVAVDDNVIANVGSNAGDPNEGTIQLFMANSTAYPSRDAATNVSVSRNKVASSNVAVPTFGKAAVLVFSTGALVTEGKNITVDDNEVFNHQGDAIAVALGYGSLQNLSVSGNKVRTVNGRAIYVSGMDNINGLNVSHNVIQRALNAGSVAGDGTIEVDTDNGNGFVFTGNRLSAASRRGILLYGGGASSLLEGITVTGNMVDFTNGATTSEEGIYLFWQYSLSDVTVTGNTVREAETGIYVDGGLPSSIIGIISEVTRVTVTGNTVTARDYGVWVSNHTTNSGLGISALSNVVVSNNSIVSSTANLIYGVLVDTIFDGLDRVTVTGNTVNMGVTSKGHSVCVDANDATPTSVTVDNNSVVYGDMGVSLLMNTTRLTNASVSRNSIETAGNRGVWVNNMNALRNVFVDENKVQTVTTDSNTGYGIIVEGSLFTSDSTNVSISGNHINATKNSGISLKILRDATSISTPAVRNLSICRNKIGNWHDGAPFAYDVPAINVLLCGSVANPHPLYNLDVSHNSCVKFGDNYASGFYFGLDEETQQVTFAHNQVRLDGQPSWGSMEWQFVNTGGATPKDFVFAGNLFRMTGSVAATAPAYSGTTGDFATFHGNIGAGANFWTNFATNWATYVPATINNQNIDDGT